MSKFRNGGDERPSEKPEGRYEVGYGKPKPPFASRFKPKQSGNPRGRPLGSKNRIKDSDLASIVLSEAQRTIKINDGERSIKVPVAKAIVRAIAINAMKGNPHAQRQATELMHAAEREKERKERELVSAVLDYKMRAQEELDRRARFGTTGPEVIPHPDQIIVDLRNDDIRIVGPLTKEEKAESIVYYEEFRDTSRQMVQVIKNRLATSEQAFEEESDPAKRRSIYEEIERDKDLIDELKRRSEEMCERLRPWGFEETRDLWEGPVELKFPWAP